MPPFTLHAPRRMFSKLHSDVCSWRGCDTMMMKTPPARHTRFLSQTGRGYLWRKVTSQSPFLGHISFASLSWVVLNQTKSRDQVFG